MNIKCAAALASLIVLVYGGYSIAQQCTVDGPINCTFVRQGDNVSCKVYCPSGNPWHPGFTCYFTVSQTPQKHWTYWQAADGGYSWTQASTNCTARCPHPIHYCSYEGCSRRIVAICTFTGPVEPIYRSADPGCKAGK